MQNYNNSQQNMYSTSYTTKLQSTEMWTLMHWEVETWTVGILSVLADKISKYSWMAVWNVHKKFRNEKFRLEDWKLLECIESRWKLSEYMEVPE